MRKNVVAHVYNKKTFNSISEEIREKDAVVKQSNGLLWSQNRTVL